MPYGRGHKGGDGSNDHTRHHYHHSHQLNNHHLPRRHVYFTSNGYHSNPFRYRPCLWLFAGIVLTLVLALAIVLPIRYTVSQNDTNIAYSPMDMVIITFSHPFCDKLILQSSVSKNPIVATIYLLDQRPMLGIKHQSGFYREAILTNNYEYWNMFLYSSSNTNFSACYIMLEGSFMPTFYLVKGDSNYNSWRIDHSKNYLHRQDIDTACTDNNNSTFTYEVDDGDNYYFIFESVATVTLGITFSFDRVLYDISNNSILDECSLVLNDSASSTCHVNVPLSSKATALLELGQLVPDLVEWDANIVVQVKCVPRAWLYVVIAISSAAFISIFIAASVISYRCCCKMRKSDRNNDGIQKEATSLVDQHSKNRNDSTVYDTYYSPLPFKPE